MVDSLLKTDGRTDNIPVFREIIAKLAAQECGGTLELGDGVYAISETLELPVSVSLSLSARDCIRAIKPFKGDAVIRKQRGELCVHNCNGWGDSYSQCYADAPFDEGRECCGFLVNKPFNRFINCRIYSNSFTFDNTVTGFLITDGGTHGSYLNNLFTAGADYRIKAAFAGNLEAATILGNGYDPNIIAGRENRIPSDTGGVSYVPALKIGDTGKSLDKE